MILTVTLNAAVDRTYRVEGFTLDRIHRAAEWRVYAGGKGVNVARVYRTLGGEAVATGFLGGYNGRLIARSASDEGIEAQFVRTTGESRVCIAIVDPTTGSQTEVNEVGAEVSAGELAALKRRFRRLLRERSYDFVTLSGSVPPGVPAAIYADLIGETRAAGVRSVLDASGEPLRLGLAARPWMVKPNRYELAQLVSAEPRSHEDLIRAACSLAGTGVEQVCVTLGGEGCVCATPDGVWRACPPPIEFVSAVGSGDSFLAAYLWALGSGRSTPEAVRLAVGAGAANAAVYGSGFCTAEAIQRLASEVSIGVCKRA